MFLTFSIFLRCLRRPYVCMIVLNWTEFYRIAVRVSNEEMWIARAPATVADLDAHFAQMSLCRLNVGNAERDVAIVARRIGVAGHIGDAHQMKLLPGAQIVPSSGESQIWSWQDFQSERVFIKAGRAFDVGYKESGVMKTSDCDWHNCSPYH